MGSFEFKIGEHYRYRGQRFQIVDLHGECVQMRALEGGKIVLRQTHEMLLRAIKRGDLVKDQEAPIEKDPQKILSGLPEAYSKAFNRIAYYTQGLMEGLHGKMPNKRALVLINNWRRQTMTSARPA